MSLLTGGEQNGGNNTNGGGTVGAGASGADGNSNGGGNTGASNNSTAQSGQSSWRDSLPDDIKSNPSISSFQDLPSFAKAFIETKSAVGKKGVILPTEKSSDEEWKNYYGQLTGPADKYDIPLPSTLKDVKFQDGAIDKFKEVALESGLLPKQAAKLLEWNTKRELALAESQQKQMDESLKLGTEALKKEWGDGYQKNVDSAVLLVKEKADDSFKKWLTESGAGNHPEMIKFFAKIAPLMGEDKLREGGVSNGAQTPAEIESQINEIMANGATNGYYDKNHPNHSNIMKKIEGLAKQRTGGR